MTIRIACPRHGSERPITDLTLGLPIVFAADTGCELVMLAAQANSRAVAFSIRHGSGFLIAALDSADLSRLDVPPLVSWPSRGPAFHVAVDAADGITTGISARDRARTLAVLADSDSQATSLVRPGHVVTARVDLQRNASAHLQFHGAAMLCGMAAGLGAPAALVALEPTDGSRTATPADGEAFAQQHGLAFITADEVTRLWYQQYAIGIDI